MAVKKVKKVTEYKYYVYILTCKNHKAIYTGVTNDLSRRLSEHKSKTGEGHTKKYNIGILVYYEVYNDAETAITREKQIKSWSRKRKTDLITLHNPDWEEIEI